VVFQEESSNSKVGYCIYSIVSHSLQCFFFYHFVWLIIKAAYIAFLSYWKV